MIFFWSNCVFLYSNRGSNSESPPWEGDGLTNSPTGANYRYVNEIPSDFPEFLFSNAYKTLRGSFTPTKNHTSFIRHVYRIYSVDYANWKRNGCYYAIPKRADCLHFVQIVYSHWGSNSESPPWKGDDLTNLSIGAYYINIRFCFSLCLFFPLITSALFLLMLIKNCTGGGTWTPNLECIRRLRWPIAPLQ